VICELPDSPLSYLDPFPDGYPQNFKGQRPSYSTLDVFVIKGISPSRWIEVSSFVDYDENDDCYVVETDEYGASLIRFGNGINGKKLPNDAEVQCRYQIGLGQSGNVGADQIRIISQGYSWGSKIRRFWNPFNVVNGREPESLEEIRRNIPEAFTHKQYRAVTVNNLIDDYELRAEELSEVSKALATYRWMGSWRIVQLHIDPSESVEVTPELERNILLHIDSVKLIGDHVVINSAKYTPLEIKVSVCIHPNYWIEDIRYQIEAEFTSGYTPDGRKGFFNPDSWTFGQMVEKSQIIGRIQAIEGVDHVIDGNPNSIIIKKWLESSSTPNEIIIQPNEIIQVMNNPNQIEKGFMFLDFKGGRH
jgi:predicted phage baseplate assembly protein